MNERPDDLRDDLLRARLESAVGATPPRLAPRLEHLAAAGLRSGRPEPRPASFWLEFGPLLAGSALMLALVASTSRFLELVVNPAPLVARVPALQVLTSPGALSSLMLPLGVLLLVEALRGAPAVRRWLR